MKYTHLQLDRNASFLQGVFNYLLGFADLLLFFT
jgi:hypothetical protein